MRIHAFHRLYQYRLERSTKPFLARGSRIIRCPYCHVSEAHCLCAHQPDVDTDVAVMLIVSENEVFKPSNTGRLIADIIKETYVFQWSRTEPAEEMLAILNDPAYFPVLVFPAELEEDKQRVMTALPERTDRRKPLLIFLDGSWREAKRIFRKSDYLANLPLVSIEPETLSRYVMRKSDNEQHLATAEVASLVLDKFGEYRAADTLRLWFDAFKESYLMCKSRLKVDGEKIALKRFIEHRESEKSL
ncbi:tRNA-uridine aminocarboxypropyltransferase [Vibrio fluvialis]|uniref:tRNA-uridine aminocarboxypropyltransferase n=1 Tax=Vibrio fluvialis TaxID=676 RepID=UPI001C9C15A0|nr:tRNA-uridine aminocarboxypropyltransferase [Vibrio fluvialis]EKO3904762.1 DTW domain-containing protein [Vibrio fluvialis]EKO3961418.1 DTW domain-containing protein [Vibrio fluvialis]MBY7787819.1 DTW domain-containing protein [Vibrio fluvialis]MBY7972722.1 DTW domain-containing protein [Vibrio fluvialis]MBY8222068.1 DTW domain-containing protein [Vibrio fluvialis]